MTWTKLSDDFGDDCWTLSDAAFRLHVEGLCYSNRKLLDLSLPKEEVRRFAKNPEAVAELVAAGWWSDRPDRYDIHHHGAFQRSREAVIKQQEANAANGAQGGRANKKTNSRDRANGGFTPQETQSVSHSLNDSQSDSQSDSVSHPQESIPPEEPEVEDSPPAQTNSLSDSLYELKSERDWTGSGTGQAPKPHLQEKPSRTRTRARGVPSGAFDLGLPVAPVLSSTGEGILRAQVSTPCPRCGKASAISLVPHEGGMVCRSCRFVGAA